MVQVTAGVLFELMRFCVVIRNYIFETFYIALRGIIQNNKNIEYFAQSSKFQHLRITFFCGNAKLFLPGLSWDYIDGKKCTNIAKQMQKML